MLHSIATIQENPVCLNTEYFSLNKTHSGKKKKA